MGMASGNYQPCFAIFFSAYYRRKAVPQILTDSHVVFLRVAVGQNEVRFFAVSLTGAGVDS